MKFKSILRRSLSVVFGTAILFCATAAYCQSTSFTYQGRLTDGGTAANGNYDLQFALFDSLSGGSQVGSTQTLSTVAVSSGVFTVSLDFGASAFNGASRFLEITARPSGGGSFTTLSPRQQITSTPYAVRSLNASSADSVPASGVPAGSGNYIQNSTSLQSTSNFNIAGNGTAGGVLSGSAINATTQYNLNGLRILSNSGTDNLFIGVLSGSANPGSNNTFVGVRTGASITIGQRNTFVGGSAGNLNTTGTFNSFFGYLAGQANGTGNDNSFFGDSAGFLNTTGFSNSFFGSVAGAANTAGSDNSYFGAGAGNHGTGNQNTFIGSAADFKGPSPSGDRNTLLGARAKINTGAIFSPLNATAIGANAQVDNSNSLVLGSINGINGATADTNVGIGTTTPTSRLTVVATGDGARVLQLGTERAWVFKQLGTGAASALELTGDDPNNNNKNFLINTQGNVGIGTTGPLDRLHVFGDIRVGVTGTNGCLKNNNGGTIIGTCASDLRFKRNLTPFGPILHKVTSLQPKYFFWRAQEFPQKNFGAEREVGLIAQEVEQVLPELVSEDEQGYKQIDYSKLPLMLLQAIKEQQAQIKAQEQRINQQQDLAKQQSAALAAQQQQLRVLKKLVCRTHRRAAVCK